MSLMLVNPRKRGRSAAQKAATRRMLAARHGKRASNPKRRTKRASVRRRNPIGLSRVTRHVRRSKRRSNPLPGMGGMGGMLMNSIKGAGGAVVVNAVTNYMPAFATTGKMVYVTRTVLALALGTFGRKVLGASARPMAEGALTVNFHDAINMLAGTMLPGSGLHGVGEIMSQSGARLGPPGTSAQHFDSELNGVGEYMYR